MNQKERYQQARRVTLIGALVNALLGLIKIIGGVCFDSGALVADGIHSFADLASDFMVVIASKYGSETADARHPYGHQRIETATSLILSFVLALIGAGIIWEALDEIINHIYEIPGILALPIALVSILANEALFQYTRYIGKKIKSELILVNAWHHRSDAASSLIVLIGLMGSLAGYKTLDGFAAIIVGAFILKMSWNYFWTSIKELIDTAVEPTLSEQIKAIITQTDGVVKIHQLRSRLMGSDIYIDVHVQVSPWISVSEGHYIAQQVHHALFDAIPKIKDVTVHIDPEDDEVAKPSLHLPSRTLIEKELLLPWQETFPQIEFWVLHYLDGKITIDLMLNKITEQKKMHARIQADIETYADVKTVRFYQNTSR